MCQIRDICRKQGLRTSLFMNSPCSTNRAWSCTLYSWLKAPIYLQFWEQYYWQRVPWVNKANADFPSVFLVKDHVYLMNKTASLLQTWWYLLHLVFPLIGHCRNPEIHGGWSQGELSGGVWIVWSVAMAVSGLCWVFVNWSGMVLWLSLQCLVLCISSIET
jgi:hypothetical protein